MNINLAKYNCILFFLYLFLAAYNLVFYSTYKDDQCKSNVAITRLLPLINPLEFLHEINSKPLLPIEKIENSSNFSIPFTEPLPRHLQNSSSSTTSNLTQQFQTIVSSIQLSSVPFAIGLTYIILAGLSMFAACSINWFSHMLPEKFASLGCMKGSVGCFIRNNPKLMRLAHYALLIMIILQFVFITTNAACKTAKHVNGEIVTVGEMYDQSIVYNIVTLCFWGGMFIGFPFIKAVLPQEAFIFEPYDSDIGILRYIFCSFLGPN